MLSFKEVVDYCTLVQGGFTNRDALYTRIDEAYLLKHVGMPAGDWIKPTISPDARNKLDGAKRLLTAADPQWSVPRDKNRDDIEETLAGDIEKAATIIWQASGRVKRKPMHYTAVQTGLLYGQVDIAITSTKVLLENTHNKNDKLRIEKVAKLTPLIFEVLNPKTCYPVFDNFGLAAHYSKREMLVVDVKSRMGAKASTSIIGKKDLDTVTYNEFWNGEQHTVWLDGASDPMIDVAHELPVIPIASAIIEGDEIFDADFRRQPFLYTLIESGLAARQNLMLTIGYSLTFAMGSNPIFVYKAVDKNTKLDIDFSNPGGVFTIGAGEDIQALNRNIMDKSMMDLMQLAEQKGIESTMFGQALGEPLSGNAPYSMVSLLSQSGRLPLVPYQRMISNVITDAMQIGFEILRANKEDLVEVGAGDKGIKVDLNSIPNNVEVIATLDIDMPQDKAQQARIANELTQGERPLMSMERARSEILQIGQSKDEDAQISTERAANAYWQMGIQEILETEKLRIQMKLQQMQQQAAQQGQPQQGQQPMQQPQPQQMEQPMPDQGQMPPELMQMMQQGQQQGLGAPGPQTGMPGAQEGLPLEGPLPGQMQGIPPEGM